MIVIAELRIHYSYYKIHKHQVKFSYLDIRICILFQKLLLSLDQTQAFEKYPSELDLIIQGYCHQEGKYLNLLNYIDPVELTDPPLHLLELHINQSTGPQLMEI